MVVYLRGLSACQGPTFTLVHGTSYLGWMSLVTLLQVKGAAIKPHKSLRCTSLNLIFNKKDIYFHTPNVHHAVVVSGHLLLVSNTETLQSQC